MNETDEYGYTGLHMASENGHLEVVKLLVAEKAGLDKLVFESYLTPLHLALSKVGAFFTIIIKPEKKLTLLNVQLKIINQKVADTYII